MKHITLASVAAPRRPRRAGRRAGPRHLQPKTARRRRVTPSRTSASPTRPTTPSPPRSTVQFPRGLRSASYQRRPGLDGEGRPRRSSPRRSRPTTARSPRGSSRITWTATSKADGIAPGQFQDFPLSVQIPGKAGDTLTFKALQTYSDGEVVRWIGAPDADKPAPTGARSRRRPTSTTPRHRRGRHATTDRRRRRPRPAAPTTTTTPTPWRSSR